MAQVEAAVTTEREAFYRRIDAENLTPLWSVMGALITPEPKSACVPCAWRFADIRKHLIEAGRLITAKEAQRRVLVLENPGMRGQSKVTTSLYAGIQLVIPGEVAPAHRHSQSALRLVLEGEGGHTAVGGEKTFMRYGDFVITPAWAWHDHGNQTKDPMMWLDGLDIPVVQFFDASFAEDHMQDEQTIDRATGDSLARFGTNMLPVDHKRHGPNSPIFSYPYARSREALEAMKTQNEWDPCHGLKMKYANPLDGGHAMSTIGTFLQLLPKGFSSSRYRATDATVFVCTEGSGRTQIGNAVIEWGKKDVFVAPSWNWIDHQTDGDAVLFSFSDRPVHEKLGFFREQRGYR